MPFLAIVIALLASVSPFPVQVAQGARSANVDALPTEIPLFPLPEVVLFPGVPRPLLIFEPRYREMVADALKGNKIIGMVLLRPGYEKDYEGRPPIYGIGCAGVIEDYEQLPDGRYGILLRGLTTFRVVSEDQRKPYRLARVEAVPDLLTDEERAPSAPCGSGSRACSTPCFRWASNRQTPDSTTSSSSTSPRKR